MYRIEAVDGSFVVDVDYLNYVKRDDETQTWISAVASMAELIAVKGQLYNIAGYPVINGYPIVKIYEMVDIKDNGILPVVDMPDITFA